MKFLILFFFYIHVLYLLYVSPYENIWNSAMNTPGLNQSILIQAWSCTQDSPVTHLVCTINTNIKNKYTPAYEQKKKPCTLTQLDCYARVWAEPAFSASAERTSWKILLVAPRLYLTHMWCNCFFYYNPDRGNSSGRQDMDPSRKRLNLQSLQQGS